MRLALGTVRFGMPYGVANSSGRPPEGEVAAILEAAREYGIDMLDTAPAYGDCETLLGRCAAARPFRVVTKTRPSDGGPIDVARGLALSLAQLRRPRVHALLVHSVRDATGPEAGRILDQLRLLKIRGEVEKIGITVYDPDDIARFRFIDAIDIVQLPLNILDQRFHVSGTLAALAARGIEIHVRSIFLQGLLLMPPEALPAHFVRAGKLLARLRATLARHGQSPLQGALAFANAVAGTHCAIVGVERTAQLREIAAAAKTGPAFDFAEFACDATEIIDPRRWPRFH